MHEQKNENINKEKIKKSKTEILRLTHTMTHSLEPSSADLHMEEGSSDQGQKHWDYAVGGANGEKTTEE